MNDIECNDLEKAMQELSSKAGGSIINRIIKKELSKTETVLFVGLGGLRLKTVKQIKKICKTEFEINDRIGFLAVDTDICALSAIADDTYVGYMESNELFNIFDNNAIHLLENPTEEIKAWLGDLQPRLIDNTGAQMTRQIGRIMLCGTQKYMDLRTAISDKISALRRVDTDVIHPTHVVLVTGISGGTGSGTFIDVAYMIRDILAYYDNLMIPTKLWGCFYTPDVQKTVPAIAGDPVKWNNMQSNGYAALKELDYFMSNGNYAIGAPPIYSLRAPGGIFVKSSKPVFDEGCAFIVSPNSMNTDVKDIISATARSLIYMHQDVSDVGGNVQSILSTYSNTFAIVQTWASKHAGECKNSRKPKDASGIENTDYPVFMNYKYSTFASSSVYFPRDEMMAYCANRVFSKVIKKWKKSNLLNQEIVAEFAKKHNIATIEQIVSVIKNTMINMGYCGDDLRIDKVKNAQYWPKVIGSILFGRVSGTNSTMEGAELMASKKIAEFDTWEKYNTCYK